MLCLYHTQRFLTRRSLLDAVISESIPCCLAIAKQQWRSRCSFRGTNPMLHAWRAASHKRNSFGPGEQFVRRFARLSGFSLGDTSCRRVGESIPNLGCEQHCGCQLTLLEISPVLPFSQFRPFLRGATNQVVSSSKRHNPCYDFTS